MVDPQFWNYPFKAFSLELLSRFRDGSVSKQLNLILKRDRNNPVAIPGYGSFCDLESNYIVAKIQFSLEAPPVSP